MKSIAAALGLQAIFRDWRVPVEVKVASDSSTALSIAGRRGLGRVRHIQTSYPWVQERVARKEVTLEEEMKDVPIPAALKEDMGWSSFTRPFKEVADPPKT